MNFSLELMIPVKMVEGKDINEKAATIKKTPFNVSFSVTDKPAYI